VTAVEKSTAEAVFRLQMSRNRRQKRFFKCITVERLKADYCFLTD